MEYKEAILRFEGCNKEYIISSDGKIFDPQTNKYRVFVKNHKGYYRCGFHIHKKYKQKFVHRLVLMTFNPIEGMENLQVNHKNGNKLDNSLENLEWCTNEENKNHAIRNGLWKNCYPTGDMAHHKKLSVATVKEIKRLLRSGVAGSKVGRMFNISKSTISQIKRGVTWKDVE